MQRAMGHFRIELTPVGDPDAPVGALVVRKRFTGDLVGESTGRMLAVGTDVEGSAGYVAMERVTGVLRDRRGSFVLQHNGTMQRGVSTMTVTIVPDSGTEDLEGLSGAMEIRPDDGKHGWVLSYELPD